MRAVLVGVLLATGCGRLAFDTVSDGQTSDVAPVTYRDAVLADRPVGYWRLGDGGPVAKDEMGAVDGSYLGACSFGAPGALTGDADPAVRFDGTSCDVSLGDTFSFIGTVPYTLEAWVSFARVDVFQFVISKQTRTGNSPVDGYLLLESDTGVYAERANNVMTSTSMRVPLAAGRFYHLATVFDGTVMQLYVDGVAAGPPVMNPVTLNAFSAVTTIGANQDAGVCFVDGVIDEVAFYDHALTEAQLALHSDVGHNGPR